MAQAPISSHSPRRGDAPDVLVQAILVTIFCCQIGGIVAIVYAAQANSARSNGNWEQAARSASTAKTWIQVSVATPFVLMVVYALLAVVLGVTTGGGN